LTVCSLYVPNCFKEKFVDWQRAIEINRQALTRIVSALVALLAAQGGARRLPLSVYRVIARLLHPAESAVRRLVVITSRNLVVPSLPSRPMPPGLVIAGKGTGAIAFQLFDSRQYFSNVEDEAVATGGPRIRVVGDPDPRSQFLAKFADPFTGTLSSETETVRLSRRLDAINRALNNLSREANRMARWRARRAAMTHPKFTSPLRPGPPPGQRKHGKDDIDHVLRECHALAWDVLTEDTS
jgi:hypothetical protein